MRTSLLQAAAVATVVMVASPATAGTWVAAVPVQGSTSMNLFGINDTNIVTGEYVDSNGAAHGFVGPFDGSNYTSFDDSGTGTEPRALNDKGLITGYDTASSVPWERFADGTLTTITMDGNPLNKIAQGINKRGIFAGNYEPSGTNIGYLGKKAKYSSQISLSIANSGLAGRAINNAGDVGGWYLDSSSVEHGFVIIGGTATGLDYPGAAYTVVEGMNDKGYVTGQYQDSSGFTHGFLYTISTGEYTSLDAPGASNTQAWGISNKDVVAVSSDVGSYVYCLKAKTCPVAGAGAVKSQHVSGTFSPALP